TKIPALVFMGCSSVTNITIPSSVTSRGDFAFYGCSGLTNIYYSGTEEQWNSISIGSRNYFNHIHYNCTNPDGHYTLTKVINPSTCADEGYSEYTCPCGYTLVKDYTYLEHTPGEWIVSIEATCTTDGYKYQRCTACGKRLSEEAIPSTGHTAGEWQLIAPTCTESGLEGKCCTICGELLEGEIIAALGGSHTFSEWENVDNKNQRTCDTCGYVEYKSVLGDLNGDGYVSAKDAQLILHNIAGIFAFESESLVESADMNKDGKISAVDARMVLQLVAGLWEKEDYIIIPYEGYNIFEKNVSVKSGDVVEVTIQLNDNSCLSCLTLMPYFEESVFKIVESEAGSLGATVNASNGVTTMATSNSFESGTIYTFTLEALKTTDSTIGVTVIEACDAKFNDITVTSDIVKCTVKLDSMDVDEPAIPEVPCADGHTWGEWEAGTAATCAEYGTKVRTCTVCGGKEFTSTPTTAHNYTWYTISVATCETDGVMLGECSECEDVDVKATAKLGHNLVDGVCQRCGLSEENITEPDTPVTPDEPENGEFSFLIKEPSITTIRHLDGIVLHANIEGNLPDGAYIKWTADNKNFDMEESADGRTLTITSKNDGDTTFYAIVYDADGEVITSDSITMTSKAGFFDKIGSFFRSLFGSTKIYEN
ncbi:MAG: leucine-rich repeat protein, partial [Clostridia bacterium]|nr:leucine-rich repeat protein [Clostridia bacterium]